MSEHEHATMRDLVRDPVEIGSFLLIYSGFFGTAVHPLMILLTALGLALPHLLMTLGVIRRDEFYREASLKAGRTALIMVGLLLVGVMAFHGMGTTYDATTKTVDDAVPASLVLLLGVLSYQLSFLIIHWGVRQAASRIYLAAGAVTIALTVAIRFHMKSVESPTAFDWVPAIAIPAGLFLLSWLSLRRARLAGFLGLLGTLWVARDSGLANPQTYPNVPWDVIAMILVFVCAPLIVPSGFLLLSRDE